LLLKAEVHSTRGFEFFELEGVRCHTGNALAEDVLPLADVAFFVQEPAQFAELLRVKKLGLVRVKTNTVEINATTPATSAHN
jgi:hypothetical protein